MKSYGKLAVGLIAIWFAVVVSASASHFFENSANGLGIAIGIAALTPIIVFSVWFTASDGFRRFALTLKPQLLTVIQSARVFGFTFVLMEAHRALPAVFALPAGYGDMAIGATASFVAWKLASPDHRASFILWQCLGIADLITAVTLGTTAGLLNPHGPSMAAMTVLPFSLIPTFFVPLYLISHVICIAQARTWKSDHQDALPTTSLLRHSTL